MKRFAIAAMVMVAMLVGAGSAFAAINNYTATYKFSGKPGTASKPAPISFSQDIQVTAATPGSRTGLLKTIQTSISGVNVNVTHVYNRTVVVTNNSRVAYNGGRGGLNVRPVLGLSSDQVRTHGRKFRERADAILGKPGNDFVAHVPALDSSADLTNNAA